ncbi:MAG TPA: TIGR00730 family Rossman fold protein [Tepidisphaeraceae bacterium]|jgi:hypothetical protein
MPIQAITVYCSSSSKVDQAFVDAARNLGSAIAKENWKLVYGGNNVGLMGALANAARAAGGKVIGVTPRLFVDKGSADEQCDELIVTDGMRDRKALLEERGDAFITLPGGLGTFEELFEIICGKVLGYHTKPIVLLNIENYYAPLLAMITHGIEHHFIKSSAQDLYFVADSVQAAIDHIRHYTPPAPAERTYETSRTSAAE